jgi:oligopeptide transport system permease protein
MLVSLFVLISATFFLMKAIPGDPFTSEKKSSAGNKSTAYTSNMDWTSPLYHQYVKYLGEYRTG